MANTTQDHQAEEKSLLFFCPGCHRECDVQLTVRGDEIISVTGNICPVGGNYARSQYEEDMQAKRMR